MDYSLIITTIGDVAILSGGAYLIWLMWHTKREMERVLARLNGLPEPILADLKRRRKKNPVKYMRNGTLYSKEELDEIKEAKLDS